MGRRAGGMTMPQVVVDYAAGVLAFVGVAADHGSARLDDTPGLVEDSIGPTTDEVIDGEPVSLELPVYRLGTERCLQFADRKLGLSRRRLEQPQISIQQRPHSVRVVMRSVKTHYAVA